MLPLMVKIMIWAPNMYHAPVLIILNVPNVKIMLTTSQILFATWKCYIRNIIGPCIPNMGFQEK